MNVLCRTLAAALLLLIAVPLQARAASAPALWVVEHDKARIYIFGTIHVLKPNVSWDTPVIDDALAKSDDLWLEVATDPSDVSAILPQVQSLGMDPDHPLSSKISKDDLAALDARFKAAGLPGEAAFEPFRPWFAGLMVSMLPALKAGYSTANGVETTLRAKVKVAGKPIDGLETIADQLKIFSDMSQTQEVAFLHDSLAKSTPKDDDTAIDQLSTLWENGNVEQATAVEAKFVASDPAFGAAVLTNRNANWAKKLDERLHGTGTSFVAVGMLHLAGPGSLIDDLTKLGYTVKRIE